MLVPRHSKRPAAPLPSIRDRVTVSILGIIKIEGTGKGVALATGLGLAGLFLAAAKMLLPLFH